MVQSTRSGGGGRAICYCPQAEGRAELRLAMAAMMARRMVWPSNAEARVSRSTSWKLRFLWIHALTERDERPAGSVAAVGSVWAVV
jgi:hypothetical protein